MGRSSNITEDCSCRLATVTASVDEWQPVTLRLFFLKDILNSLKTKKSVQICYPLSISVYNKENKLYYRILVRYK